MPLFCPSFAPLLSPFLSFCSCFPCLSSCPLCLPCLFLCPCVSLLLFPFPYRTIRKKKGRKGLSLASSLVLLCACFIWLLLCIPRTRQVSARLYRNKVLEKGNLIECSKLFCARLCSYLCSSKFVFLLFPYLLLLVGSYFLFPFGGVLAIILLLQFDPLRLCTPSLPHCKLANNNDKSSSPHHRSTQMKNRQALRS